MDARGHPKQVCVAVLRAPDRPATAAAPAGDRDTPAPATAQTPWASSRVRHLADAGFGGDRAWTGEVGAPRAGCGAQGRDGWCRFTLRGCAASVGLLVSQSGPGGFEGARRPQRALTSSHRPAHIRLAHDRPHLHDSRRGGFDRAGGSPCAHRAWRRGDHHPAAGAAAGVDLRYAIGASLLAVVATSCGSAAAFVRVGFTNVRVAVVLEVLAAAARSPGRFLPSTRPTL